MKGQTLDYQDVHVMPKKMRESMKNVGAQLSETSRRLSISQKALSSTESTDWQLEQQVDRLLPQSTIEVAQDATKSEQWDTSSDSEESGNESLEVDVLQVIINNTIYE